MFEYVNEHKLFGKIHTEHKEMQRTDHEMKKQKKRYIANTSIYLCISVYAYIEFTNKDENETEEEHELGA